MSAGGTSPRRAQEHTRGTERRGLTDFGQRVAGSWIFSARRKDGGSIHRAQRPESSAALTLDRARVGSRHLARLTRNHTAAVTGLSQARSSCKSAEELRLPLAATQKAGSRCHPGPPPCSTESAARWPNSPWGWSSAPTALGTGRRALGRRPFLPEAALKFARNFARGQRELSLLRLRAHCCQSLFVSFSI